MCASLCVHVLWQQFFIFYFYFYYFFFLLSLQLARSYLSLLLGVVNDNDSMFENCTDRTVVFVLDQVRPSRHYWLYVTLSLSDSLSL